MAKDSARSDRLGGAAAVCRWGRHAAYSDEMDVYGAQCDLKRQLKAALSVLGLALYI